MRSGDVNLRTKAIAAGFLFGAGVAGGLILSRKVSQFLFQSSTQANAAAGERGGEQKREGKSGGGAGGSERQGASGSGGGKSSKSDGSEESDKKEGEGKDKKDSARKAGGKSASAGASEDADKNDKSSADKKDADRKPKSAPPKLDAKAAHAVLAGNSVQKPEPGGEPRSIYYSVRNLVGESEGNGIFAVRRWSLAEDRICETDAKLGPQCRPLDVQFTPENAARLRPKDVKPAPDDGLYDDAAALVASLPKGSLIGTIAAEETRYLVLKGNVAGFPDYVPTVDAGQLPDVKAATVAPSPPVASAPLRKSGFVEIAATSGFKVINPGPSIPVAAADDALEQKASGSAAMEHLRGHLLRGGELLRDQTPAHLAWLRADGTFMQIMREEDRPFEVRLKLSPWKASGERFCRERPAPAGRGKAGGPAPKPIEDCVVPRLNGASSNLTDDSGERLTLYPKLEPPRIRL
jgi:hypothetical protein